MVRSPASIRGRAAGREDDAAVQTDDDSGGLLRKLLLGVGVAAVTYVAVRALRSGGQSTDESDDWYQLSIGESVEEADDGTDAAPAPGEDTDELPDEEEVLEERAEEDVQSEPAEPGEMTVDEDVVDEITDEDNGDSEDA